MARAPALAEPEVQDRYIDALGTSASADEAARAVGLTRQAVARYARAHPEFADRVQAARERGQALASMPARASAPSRESRRLIPRVGDQDLTDDADRAAKIAAPLAGITAEYVLGLCVAHADPDRESRAAGTALRILAEFGLGPVVRAQQRREAREAEEAAAKAEGERPGGVVLAVPSNGTHALERAGRRSMPVLDAEVLEGD